MRVAPGALQRLLQEQPLPAGGQEQRVDRLHQEPHAERLVAAVAQPHVDAVCQAAALIQAEDLQANTIKVVTESGTVFLMGLVSQREANRAAEVASRVSGVQRVVTAFELIVEQAPSAQKR